MEQDLRRIVYDETDVPRPTSAGGVLWVLLFFLSIPLMLLVHWFFQQQPPASIWLRLVSVLTFGDWRVGLVGIVTFSACIGLVAWLMQTSSEVGKFVQSVTDDAGLLGLRLPTLIVTPLLTIPMLFLRKIGIVELALMSGVEIALASAKTVKRFPKETVDLVPSDLLVDVEQLKKGQGEVVTFSREFAPEPLASKEGFALQIAFSAERLEQARESDHSVNSDADLQRFVHSSLQMPEIFAIASLLHEEHQKRGWAPFQRAMNILSMLESFAFKRESLPKRLPIETLHEGAGTSSDLVIAASTLLRALGETVPEAVLVVRGDGQGVALGIAGASELPETFRGFEHAGEFTFSACHNASATDGDGMLDKDCLVGKTSEYSLCPKSELCDLALQKEVIEMAAKAYKGRKGWLERPFLTIEGNEAYEGEGGWLAEPVLTFEGNEIYRGRKGWFDTPIATVKGNEVYEGQGGWLAEPIATLKPTDEGWEIYEGRPGWFDEPIATVEGGGRMAAACAAVYLLLM